MSPAVAWALSGAALVVVGLGIAVAVLGVKLGRAHAATASTAAELATERRREQERTAERDRALAQLEDERARAAKQLADLRRDVQSCDELVAENLPPEALRQRFRDLLSSWSTP
jgi:uncharacterized protein HemX